MIIKSIEFENIRSYKNCKIEFIRGINFLSGDIGSGKSSCLQAIEFALLGFKRGDLEGIHLLRKGEITGSVKLILENKNKEIEIFRKLKKSKSQTISQENGYLKIDSNLIELSPSELNSQIFEILNFPKEFISKDKNLIYRFTIYTPQEQLKEILFSSVDKRLEIIRKIFAIDKYKNLKDAILIYNQKIREDKKFLEAKIDINFNLEDKIYEINLKIKNLNKKKDEEFLKEKPLKEKEEKYSNLILKYNEILEKITEKIILVEKNLSKIEELEFQNKKLEIEKEEKNNLLKEISNKSFEEEIKKIDNDIKKYENENLEINKEISKIKTLELEYNKINEKKIELDFKIISIEKDLENKNDELKQTIKLHNCPTCFQKVSLEHKDKLKKEFENKNDLKLKEKNEFENELSNLKSEQKKLLGKNNSFKEILENILKSEKNKLENISNLKLNKEKLLNLLNKEKNIKEDILKIENKIQLQNSNILKKKSLEEKNKLLKEKENLLKLKIKEIQELQNNLNKRLREVSNNLIEIKTNIISNQEELKKQEKDFFEFNLNKNKFENLINLENFLNKKIINISQNIETYIFTKYYNDFNLEFENFFKELIEDNEIEVRLSKDFSPIIEQNGHDVDISNLSGGEKSSLAISYRFGLKKIIENSQENSNNSSKLSLLILDEPTDGFSSVQVDRLGQILKNLNLDQIILVSHDTRIDSISDKIISIEKENHISSIIN